MPMGPIVAAVRIHFREEVDVGVVFTKIDRHFQSEEFCTQFAEHSMSSGQYRPYAVEGQT